MPIIYDKDKMTLRPDSANPAKGQIVLGNVTVDIGTGGLNLGLTGAAAGKVLTSDKDGNASWDSLPAGEIASLTGAAPGKVLTCDAQEQPAWADLPGRSLPPEFMADNLTWPAAVSSASTGWAADASNEVVAEATSFAPWLAIYTPDAACVACRGFRIPVAGKYAYRLAYLTGSDCGQIDTAVTAYSVDDAENIVFDEDDRIDMYAATGALNFTAWRPVILGEDTAASAIAAGTDVKVWIKSVAARKNESSSGIKARLAAVQIWRTE